MLLIKKEIPIEYGQQENYKNLSWTLLASFFVNLTSVAKYHSGWHPIIKDFGGH